MNGADMKMVSESLNVPKYAQMEVRSGHGFQKIVGGFFMTATIIKKSHTPKGLFFIGI